MNITLISPYNIIGSIGIRMISACLKKAGHKINLIEMPRSIIEKEGWLQEKRSIFVSKGPYDEESLNAMIDLLRKSDLIGISLSTSFFENAVQITERLKKDLNIPIIWGGIHPTIRPEECLKYADMVCMGEGEGAMVELANKIDKRESYYDVKNICFKDKNEKLILNPLRPLIQDLDSLPPQDSDLKNHYLIFKEKLIEWTSS